MAYGTKHLAQIDIDRVKSWLSTASVDICVFGNQQEGIELMKQSVRELARIISELEAVDNENKADIQATIEMLDDAIASRNQRYVGENPDVVLECWENAKAALEWAICEPTEDAMHFEEWALAHAREELGIHPRGL